MTSLLIAITSHVFAIVDRHQALAVAVCFVTPVAWWFLDGAPMIADYLHRDYHS